MYIFVKLNFSLCSLPLVLGFISFWCGFGSGIWNLQLKNISFAKSNFPKNGFMVSLSLYRNLLYHSMVRKRFKDIFIVDTIRKKWYLLIVVYYGVHWYWLIVIEKRYQTYHIWSPNLLKNLRPCLPSVLVSRTLDINGSDMSQ